jgi:hypothetical protein
VRSVAPSSKRECCSLTDGEARSDDEQRRRARGPRGTTAARGGSGGVSRAGEQASRRGAGRTQRPLLADGASSGPGGSACGDVHAEGEKADLGLAEAGDRRDNVPLRAGRSGGRAEPGASSGAARARRVRDLFLGIRRTRPEPDPDRRRLFGHARGFARKPPILSGRASDARGR